MKNFALLLITGLALGALIAAGNKKQKVYDPVELIIQKSNQTMRDASEVSARVDKQVSSSIGEMKQTIQVLEEEKEQLVEQVKVMQDEITAVKSAPMQPFDVLAIGSVPDTASRK